MAATHCRWPNCSSTVKVNRCGGGQGYCSTHYPANVARARMRISYQEYEEMGLGHRRVIPSGYVHVRVGSRWEAEHRLVMEAILGRPMRRGESVHHLNGVRHDNRPENLELWVTPQRYGQRAWQLVCPCCGSDYASAVGLAPTKPVEAAA